MGNKKTLSERNIIEALRQTIALEVFKVAARSSVRIKKMGVQTLWAVITGRTKQWGRKVRLITDITNTALGKEEIVINL
jgi:hypothetical protein